MHEFSLVKSIIDVLEGKAQENGWYRITKVTLKVGKLRQVIPDVMKFSFSIAVKGTSLEGADLEIKEMPLTRKCRVCGYTWDEGSFRCPACDVDNVDIIRGMELEIDSVEVEDQDAP